MLDRFSATPYSSAPLPTQGEQQDNMVRCPFLLYSPYGGMRTPDRGSTTGAASWTDRERSKRAAPQGRAKRVNPPSPPYSTKVRAFFAYGPCKPSRGRHKCLARATHPAGRTTNSPARRSAAGKPAGRTTNE
ncbi:hypothetical protein CH426_08020 [Klebsiella aerogenes]|nr:hypothetical protein CH426_08020 [Klebsiella aerogenes]